MDLWEKIISFIPEDYFFRCTGYYCLIGGRRSIDKKNQYFKITLLPRLLTYLTEKIVLLRLFETFISKF
jgi:hypothetical protein